MASIIGKTLGSYSILLRRSEVQDRGPASPPHGSFGLEQLGENGAKVRRRLAPVHVHADH